jgi:AraC family transcriptional regulator of adaptative response/methylated-DNA-[protein]-cysteine methyltransferase
MDAMTHDPASETLCFGYGQSRLGLVLVALSGRGVAAILLGDEPLALRRELARPVPGFG